MAHLFIQSLVILLASSLHAQVFQPEVHPTDDVDKIVVRGYRGQLQLVSTTSETVTVESQKKPGVTSPGWRALVEKKDRTLSVTIQGPSENLTWEKVVAGQSVPEFAVKVTAPAKPIEIFWHKGQFVSEKWQSELAVQVTDGDVSIKEGQGALAVQVIKGRVKVSKHKGNVKLQTYKGEATVEGGEGSLGVDNHSARYSVTKHNGPIEIRNHSGSVAVTQSKGPHVVTNTSGVMSFQKLEGSFDGQFDKGALDIQFESLQNFSFNGEQAAITLTVPKVSGARVRVRSEKGHMYVPPYLGKTRKGRWTERKGRLRGKEQGNIKIISKYGDIVLK